MGWSERQAPADPASIDIRGWLQALSGACRRALIVAAVIGYEFSLVLLATATKMRPATLTDPLEEAAAAGFVRPSEDTGSGRQVRVFTWDSPSSPLCRAPRLADRSAAREGRRGTRSAGRRRRALGALLTAAHPAWCRSCHLQIAEAARTGLRSSYRCPATRLGWWRHPGSLTRWRR
jgi:hypothetical protein